MLDRIGHHAVLRLGGVAAAALVGAVACWIVTALGDCTWMQVVITIWAVPAVLFSLRAGTYTVELLLEEPPTESAGSSWQWIDDLGGAAPARI